MHKTRVLVVDDSELICEMLKMVCESLGTEVQTFESATDVPDKDAADWIISDVNLPGVVDQDPVKTYRSKGIVGRVILISGRAQAELDEMAENTGAAGALSKDLGMMGMSAKLAELFEV
ncbi:response regulator [Microvenator marinus]|uniref:Response regulator n=1 Tax=Microvenator marinus TaxID=2600177 RepID=A0A5B8XUU8_9DELT|nr:response regulator [Microvenator marinus]QED29335.1 response regulator [Microvenator marinus]